MKKVKDKLCVKLKPHHCKGCGYCIKVCPDNALEFEKHFNASGYRPVRWKGDCKLCGLCYKVCPDHGIEIDEQETS